MNPKPPSVDRDATWVDLLRRRATSEPAKTTYRFLDDGEHETAAWSAADLDRRARAIAGLLASRARPGDRVVLAHRPGLDFVAAFFGCLYAGAVAVPTFPPRANGNGRRMTERARAIVAHAKPSVVLTTADDVEGVAAALAGPTPVVASDSIAVNTADAWRPPEITPQTLACLQYTSGTSGAPKGVMLTHAALLANCRQIQDRFETDVDTVGVVWLPPYHDMGLVGGILTPLFGGFEIVLMPPTAFLQKPLRWLKAVEHYRATVAGGPCFAFGLCAQQVTGDDAAALDLGSLKVTFTGAETVRADVLAKFAAKFAAAKFDPKSLLACYGMAETTLIVTGTKAGVGLTRRAPGGESDGESGGDAGLHVSCGPVVAPAEVVVVDPATRLPRPDGGVGEIWTRGPSVAAGYWQNADATAATFAARLANAPDDPHSYVRTGDLGFVAGGELFVTGRLKELIIVRGVNHAPHEIERIAEQAHAAVQPQGVAAFSVESDQGERLAVAVELQRAQRNADPAAVVAAVRAAVAEAHGLEAHTVVLLRPGGLPRTPSGKVQRAACRAMLADGTLEPAFASTLTTAAPDPTPADTRVAAPDFPASADPVDLQTWLVAQLASALNATPDQIDPQQPVGGYGLGSADAGDAARGGGGLSANGGGGGGGGGGDATRVPGADVLYNPMHPSYAADPYPALHRLRAAEPVHYSPLLKVWVLTRYADVVAALRAPQLSAAARNWAGYERFFLRASLERNVLDEMYKRWMLQLDGADHTRLRALTGRAFTPRAVQRMRQTVADVADGMLDRVQPGASFDVVKDFAFPLPVVIISKMLGVPAEDDARVHAWSTTLLPSFSPAMSLPTFKAVNTALGEFRDYFAHLADRRRADPQDDLLSDLIAARDESNDKLDDEELFATAILLTFAGHATTAQAIANTVLALSQRPNDLALLRARPELIGPAIEESLRFESPLQLIYRTTLEPYAIDGVTIPKGEMVFLILPAANRDPARFPEPDRFDIRRADNKHLAFGYGGHFCAGAGLARLEAYVALERLLKRFDRIDLDGPVPKRESSLLLRGLQSLPVRPHADASP